MLLADSTSRCMGREMQPRPGRRVTPRRWLAGCNPELAELITKTIGDKWITDLSQLAKLKPYAEDAAFRKVWRDLNQASKQRLVDFKKAGIKCFR